VGYGVVLKLDSWFATNAASEGLIDWQVAIAVGAAPASPDLWPDKELGLKC